jgi:hypothetical protein
MRSDYFYFDINFDSKLGKYSYVWNCSFCKEKGIDQITTGDLEDSEEVARFLGESSIHAHKYSGNCARNWGDPPKG